MEQTQDLSKVRKNSAEDFEDEFEDEYEEEVQVEAKDEEWEDLEDNKNQLVEIVETNDEEGEGEGDEDETMNDGEEEKIGTKKKKSKSKAKQKVYLGNEELQKDEELIFDNSAYEMIHRATVEWPSLSIDILCSDRFEKDNYSTWFPEYVQKLDPKKISTKQGEQGDMEQDELPIHMPTDYPFDAYVVAGSQAVKRNENKVYVMKWSNLSKTLNDDDDDEAADNENDDDDAKLYYEGIPHKGGVNRIRSMHGSNIVATWSDEGDFTIFNLSEAIQRLEKKHKSKSNTMSKGKYSSLISKFKHKQEGYALDWSPLRLGLLASGGCDKNIFLYEPTGADFS
jgi:ribosome assembly protein RRB1